jgi:outer membrane protein
MRKWSYCALALGLLITPAVAASQTPLRLSFADAVAQAAGRAPAVTLAGLRADQARAQLREARSPLLPNLSATGSWVSQTINPQSFGFRIPGLALPRVLGPFDLYDGRLHLSQALFDYAGLARVRSARSVVAGAQADSGLSAETAVQVAAMAYLQGVRARAVVSAREADSALAVELVSLAQAQKDAGVGTAIDVTRARTQLVAAEGGLVVARNQSDRARISLARALGLAPDTPLELTDTLSAGLPVADLPPERDSLVAMALAQRPDLGAERARGVAAERARAAIAAERLPRLDLAANYGANGLSPTSPIATRQIAVQVTVPILDGFRREGREAEQQAAVRASAVRVEELERQIAADVDAAQLDLESAAQQQRIAAERLRLAGDEVDQARERFKAGVAGNIEVIDAQSSLVRARDADIDARFAAAVARVALARAVGVARTLH